MEQEYELSFHGVEYIMTLAVDEEGLNLHVEQKYDGRRWGAIFPSQYLEDITRKTGNFKKFSLFVKMLSTALLNKSDSVFVDLLTFTDLEMLKSRHTKLNQKFTKSTSKRNNKRYLILTYAVEFDRVHYPLPLTFDENPTTAALQKTIKRLRKELMDTRDNQVGVDVESLQRENAELRRQLQTALIGSGNSKKDEALREETRRLRSTCDRLRRDASRAESEAETKIRQLSEQLQELRMPSSARDEADVDALREQVVTLTKKLQECETRSAEQKEEYMTLRQTIQTRRRRLQKDVCRQCKSKVIRAFAPHSEHTRKRPVRSPRKKRSSSPRYYRGQRPDSGGLGNRSTSRRRRSRSAGPRMKRFDPSAYIRNKREKIAAAQARRRNRSQSPSARSVSSTRSALSTSSRKRRSRSATSRSRQRSSSRGSRGDRSPRPFVDRPWSANSMRQTRKQKKKKKSPRLPSPRAPRDSLSRVDKKVAERPSESTGRNSASGASKPVLLEKEKENISWRWQHQKELGRLEAPTLRADTELNEMDIDRRLNELQDFLQASTGAI